MIFLPLTIMPMVIGSDFLVSAFTTQQIASDGDRIARFAALEAGFKLQGILATVTYGSFFPVQGDIELDGSTLVLTHDLVINDTGYLKLLGNIIGNKHKVDIRSDMQSIPSVPLATFECRMLFIERLEQPAYITTDDWSGDDAFCVMGLGANGTAVLKIFSFSGTHLAQRAAVQLNNQQVNVVRWHPTHDFIAVGTMLNGSGAELYIFEYDRISSTLTLRDSKNIGFAVQALTWHQVDGEYLAVGTQDTSSEIKLFSFDRDTKLLSVSPINTVNISPNQTVQIQAMDWNITSSFLAVGVSAVNGIDTLRIYEFDFNDETLSEHLSVNPGRTVSALEWNPIIPNILGIGLQGSNAELIQVYEHNPEGATLNKISGMVMAGSVLNVDWSRLTGICLATGSENQLAGQFSTFYFDQADNSLELVTQLDFGDPVRAIRWSHDGRFCLLGNDTSNFIVLESAEDYFLNKFVNFKDMQLFLNYDVQLDKILIKIQGDVAIVGRGTTLTLGPQVQLVVDSNAKLLLKDIVLKGMQSDKLRCQDGSARIIFQNVLMVLDDNTTFTQGSFNVLDHFSIEGPGLSFLYSSTVASTILARSNFKIDQDVTLIFDPINNATNILQFASNTSLLTMQGCVLNAKPGMMFTKGSIQVINSSSLLCDVGNAIIFGDGIATLQDCALTIFGGSLLSIVQGELHYKNTSNASLSFAGSSLLRMKSGTSLKLFENLPLGAGIIEFENNTLLLRSLNKKIMGSTRIFGNLTNSIF
jgi:hypothetical protein